MENYDHLKRQITKSLAESYGCYSDEYFTYVEPTLQHVAKEMCRFVNKTRGVRVVDLATGTGLIARSLTKNHLSVIGVDVAIGAVQSTHEESEGEALFLAGDVHSLPFLTGCVDQVTCSMGFSHFSDISLALTEIIRILHPSGHMLASAWGSDFDFPSWPIIRDLLYQYLGDIDNPFKDAINEELWGDIKNGCDILTKAGFKEVHTTSTFYSNIFSNPLDAVKYTFAKPLNRSLFMMLNSTKQEKFIEEAITAVAKNNNLEQTGHINYYHAKSPGFIEI